MRPFMAAVIRGCQARTIPETRLYIIGTGNPTPAYTSAPRGEGLENLYTCALVAINVDTGKMAWYYQTSPHDTHDWDSAQTPVLVDGEFGGRPRKLVLTAARNGYFFVVDRVTGEHLLTSKFSESANWADRSSTPRDSPCASRPRIITSPARWSRQPTRARRTGRLRPSAPQTGLFYVPDDRDLRDVLPDRA